MVRPASDENQIRRWDLDNALAAACLVAQSDLNYRNGRVAEIPVTYGNR